MRTILHCDLNSFFASVECLYKPELKNVPMAVAGNPDNRHGIILAKNDLAKRYGVQTAEANWQAKKKCPGLVLVSPSGDYSWFSRKINEIYQGYTDLVEPFGIDESWLDVTGVRHLFGDGKTIADKLRETIKREFGLTLSVGVSFNKIIAKLGSDYKKPDATTVINHENFKAIVHPLPVDTLLFVGNATKAALSRLYINTVGDLANADRNYLTKCLGKSAAVMHDYANGIDNSPVKPPDYKREIKSVGNGMTFKRNLLGYEDIKMGVNVLADEVAGRMRKYGVKCTVVHVTIKDPNLKSVSHQKTLPTATYLAKDLARVAMELIYATWNEKAPIRLITITGANLVRSDYYKEQISFFDDIRIGDKSKRERLELAVDGIRGRFGYGSVKISEVIGNDIGIH